MWFFLLIFFSVAFIYTVFNLSISSSKSVFWVAVLVPVIFSLVMYPICVSQSNKALENILSQSNIVSIAALIQIFEAIILVTLSILHIRGYYSLRPKRVLNWIVVLPSFVFLTGLFFLQTHWFLYSEKLSFFLMSVIFSLGTGVILIVASFCIRKLIREWEIRAELKMLIVMLQILLAMFLPLIAKGVKVPFSNLEMDEISIVFTVAIISTLSVLGFLKYHFKNKIYKSS